MGAADLLERRERAGDVFLGVGGSDREPDARFVLGDDRIAKAVHVNAFEKKRVYHLLERDDAADEHREERVLAAQYREAQVSESATELLDALLQLRERRRAPDEDLDGLLGRARAW